VLNKGSKTVFRTYLIIFENLINKTINIKGGTVSSVLLFFIFRGKKQNIDIAII